LYAWRNTDFIFCANVSGNYYAVFYIIIPINLKIFFAVILLGVNRNYRLYY